MNGKKFGKQKADGPMMSEFQSRSRQNEMPM